MNKTQLRTVPYKRQQIVGALESLVSGSRIRDINPTTKRLVDRCLTAEWCSPYRNSPNSPLIADSASNGCASPGLNSIAYIPEGASLKPKTLKVTKSMEFRQPEPLNPIAIRAHLENIRRPSDASVSSLTGIASAALPSPTRRKHAASSAHTDGGNRRQYHDFHPQLHERDRIPHVHPPSTMTGSDSSVTVEKSKIAPLTPTKRRKPPAIPTGRGKTVTSNSGATFTTIKSSS
jgi:hypothetical protein